MKARPSIQQTCQSVCSATLTVGCGRTIGGFCEVLNAPDEAKLCMKATAPMCRVALSIFTAPGLLE